VTKHFFFLPQEVFLLAARLFFMPQDFFSPNKNFFLLQEKKSCRKKKKCFVTITRKHFLASENFFVGEVRP